MIHINSSFVDKKSVFNCTAITNKWDQNLCSARFILQKRIILRLLTDLELIVLDLEPIVLDMSRVGNQPIY